MYELKKEIKKNWKGIYE